MKCGLREIEGTALRPPRVLHAVLSPFFRRLRTRLPNLILRMWPGTLKHLRRPSSFRSGCPQKRRRTAKPSKGRFDRPPDLSHT